MIFKTFESDIDSIGSKWGVFGRSFSDISDDIEKRWNNVSETLQLTNDYTLRNIANAWKTGNTSPLTFLENDKVVSILNEYNKALDSGAEATAKFLNSGTENEFMDKFLKDLDGAPATMDKYKAATKEATVAQKSFSVSTIATKAAVLALNVAVSVGLTLALSALTKVIAEVVQSEENLKNSAAELGSELINNSSSIEDYKKKIEELKGVLNNSSSSIEDVAQARINLMSVQDELIENFGTEKVVIEDITEAIYGQTEALDELSRDAYYKALDKFNEKTTGDKIKDWLNFGNIDDDKVRSNMDKMISQMELSVYSLETTGNEVLDNLIAKSLGLNITPDAYGDGKHFTIYGNLDEIQEKLSIIREMSSDFDVSTGFENDFTEISNDVNSLLEAHQDLYNQYILWEKILTDNPDNQYDEQYNLINQAKETYDEARSSGDLNAIQRASEEYSKILSSAIDLAMSNYDYDVADYFKGMYPDMQQLFGEWEFTLDFEPNTDGLKDKITDTLTGLDGMSSEAIMAFNPNVATDEQIVAYSELNKVALEYGLTLQQLINLLLQMGLIQSEDYQLLVDQFGQDNIDKLTPEDLSFAYTIENIGNMSFEELLIEIQRLKDEALQPIEITPPTITETVDAISNELKPALESLKGSYTSIFSEDGFEAGNVSIDDISSVKSALDNLKEEYKLEIDYEEYEDFVKVITDTDAEASDVQEAFNSMASMMVNASSAVKLTEENFDLLQTQLENLGITNAKEVLTDMKKAQDELAAQGKDLYNTSLEEAAGFIAVAESSSIATHYLQVYHLEKALANNPLNTFADIEALEQVCSALGITGEYWNALIKLKSLYFSLENGGAEQFGSQLQAEIQQAKADLDAIQKNQYEYKVEFDGNIIDGSGSGSGGGSSSEYDWKNLLDKEIAVLEKQLDAGLIDFDTYLGKRLDLIEKYYQEGKIKAEDYYDYLEKTYENQLSIYDRVISAVTNKLEKQIEQLEKQKETIEEGYQIQIDKLNEEIELLEKEYQKKKDLEELEQARYNAEKARNQRTKKLYTGDNFIYTHDDETVRSAEEELADKELQMNISRLEEQIESLEKEMEEATKLIDEQIEKLQEYIEQWNDVADTYEEAQNEMLASQVLGAQWEAEILALRQDILEQFKNEYIRIQEEMANAALKAAEAQLEAEKLLAKGGGSGSGSGGAGGSGGSGGNKSKDESESKSHKWEYRGKVYDSFEDAEKDAENYAKDYVNKYVGNNAYTQDALEYYINKEKNSIVKYAKGGVIKKSDNIFSPIAESIGEDTMIAVRDGERVLTPIQNKHFEKLISISDKLVPALLKGNLLNNNLFGNLQNNNMPYVPATANSINISIGDINLHEVNDVNTLSQAIISQLPNKISQAINRR